MLLKSDNIFPTITPCNNYCWFNSYIYIYIPKSVWNVYTETFFHYQKCFLLICSDKSAASEAFAFTNVNRIWCLSARLHSFTQTKKKHSMNVYNLSVCDCNWKDANVVGRIWKATCRWQIWSVLGRWAFDSPVKTVAVTHSHRQMATMHHSL